MRRGERIAWGALLVVALGLRLWALDVRPPHHDEAVHAHFADVLITQRAYRYDPTYHGPLLFFLMGGLFLLGGENLVTARLYPALAGVALVAVPLLLRRRVGPRAAWWCGALLAVSPSFLYYSRFARNDVPVALFTALALVVLVVAARTKRWQLLPWAGVAAALHAVSKETFYVTVPLLVLAALAVAARRGLLATGSRLASWARAHWRELAVTVAAFVVITELMYTFFFVHAEDFAFPLKAVRYWYEQHTIQRVGGPWYYHLPRLALYEFLPLGAGVAWLVRRRGRLRDLEVFCFVWGLASVAMYAYLGEKVPWLAVHQVLPWVLLAGAQLGRTFSARGRWWSRGVAAAALAATAWSTVAVSYRHPTITTSDPHAELLVFVQTTPEVGELVRLGRQLARTGTEGLVACVVGEGSWPLSWQWRTLKVQWTLPAEGARPALVVCDPPDEAVARERLGDGYAARRIPLRGWWVEEWNGVGPREVARWFVTRRAWSPIGATEVMVFERPGESRGAAGEGGRS